MTGPYGRAAGRYLKLGYSPLPLKPRQKYPPPKDWTGSGAPMADLEQVRFWERSVPDGNIALRLPVDVAGIDLDLYDDPTKDHPAAERRAAWRELVDRLGPLPDGREARPGDLVSPGEVIQHHHRYVVAPPSVHPSGRRYRWLGGNLLPVSDLPFLERP